MQGYLDFSALGVQKSIRDKIVRRHLSWKINLTLRLRGVAKQFYCLETLAVCGIPSVDLMPLCLAFRCSVCREVGASVNISPWSLVTDTLSVGIHSSNRRRIVISRNQSLSATALRWLVLIWGSLHAILIAIAVARGWWPVLLFSGTEFILVAVVLWHVRQGGFYQEVVTVTDDEVIIERGLRFPEQRTTFARYWAKVEKDRPQVARGHTRLTVRSQGYAVEIGRCLGEEDKDSLFRHLDALIGGMGSVSNGINRRSIG